MSYALRSTPPSNASKFLPPPNWEEPPRTTSIPSNILSRQPQVHDEDRTISQDDTAGDLARENRMLAALGRDRASSPNSTRPSEDTQAFGNPINTDFNLFPQQTTNPIVDPFAGLQGLPPFGSDQAAALGLGAPTLPVSDPFAGLAPSIHEYGVNTFPPDLNLGPLPPKKKQSNTRQKTRSAGNSQQYNTRQKDQFAVGNQDGQARHDRTANVQDGKPVKFNKSKSHDAQSNQSTGQGSLRPIEDWTLKQSNNPRPALRPQKPLPSNAKIAREPDTTIQDDEKWQTLQEKFQRLHIAGTFEDCVQDMTDLLRESAAVMQRSSVDYDLLKTAMKDYTDHDFSETPTLSGNKSNIDSESATNNRSAKPKLRGHHAVASSESDKRLLARSRPSHNVSGVPRRVSSIPRPISVQRLPGVTQGQSIFSDRHPPVALEAQEVDEDSDSLDNDDLRADTDIMDQVNTPGKKLQVPDGSEFEPLKSPHEKSQAEAATTRTQDRVVRQGGNVNFHAEELARRVKRQWLGLPIKDASGVNQAAALPPPDQHTIPQSLQLRTGRNDATHALANNVRHTLASQGISQIRGEVQVKETHQIDPNIDLSHDHTDYIPRELLERNIISYLNAIMAEGKSFPQSRAVDSSECRREMHSEPSETPVRPLISSSTQACNNHVEKEHLRKGDSYHRLYYTTPDYHPVKALEKDVRYTEELDNGSLQGPPSDNVNARKRTSQLSNPSSHNVSNINSNYVEEHSNSIPTPPTDTASQRSVLATNVKPREMSTDAEGIRIKGLMAEITALRAQLADGSGRQSSNANEAKLWPTLHRIECPLGGRATATYMDAPEWVLVERHYHLDSRRRIVDERKWELSQVNVPFVVYLTYSCTAHGQYPADTNKDEEADQTGSKDETSEEEDYDSDDDKAQSRSASLKHLSKCCKHPMVPAHTPIPTSEEVHILSRKLQKVVSETFSSDDYLSLYAPIGFDHNWTIQAPYVMNYHFRRELEMGRELCGPSDKPEFDIFLHYLDVQTAQKEAEARNLFGKGLITRDFMDYLFAPGELLVYENQKDSQIMSKKLCSLIHVTGRTRNKWLGNTEFIDFNGEFQPRLIFDDPIRFPDADATTVNIHDLPVFPLKYAATDVKSYLRNRGEFFMSCRERRYVAGPEKGNTDATTTRYMVDVKTYRLMHSYDRDPEPLISAIEETLEDDFILRLPSKIKGFHMQDKKWLELEVDRLVPVDWDMNAFESLAVDDNTKELIQAVVTNKIEADKGTDLVPGKGNGLIVLLHGGPGTGKTLTAESVAEIARKPLYRVSCGDVGTDPRKVEEYLEQVFTLGRRWGCVVLLDEADVFLEQRTFANLERNALVSVFLRVLEYYDGILLLTSNRVGTFDEAFKSRIQLAIHYDALSGSQRLRIWGNFIKRLESLEEDMDVEDVKSNLKKLSAFQLNGRQIRNAMTTARQLARYRKEKMNFTHLERAISVSTKFEKYLLEVHDQEPDEDRVRAEGIR